MKKKRPPNKPPKKEKKGGRESITRSVAFDKNNLEALQAHPAHARDRLSISWIVNRLIDKFLAGEITLP